MIWLTLFQTRKSGFQKFILKTLFTCHILKDKAKQKVSRYFLTKAEIISEDQNHYFFKFPFKAAQVEDAAV